MNICISCPDGHPVILAAEKLGQMVACPRCFATFPAEWEIGPSVGARKDDRKVRRSRDDDDEDEEEERPKKKPLAKKETAKPSKSRARDDDDDDDEEDDDDDETEGEEEPEIEWTGRKRQLNKCGVGMTVMMVAFYMLAAMIAFLILPMIWTIFDVGNKIGNSEGKLVVPKPDDWFWPGIIIAVAAVLVQTTLIIGLFFNFFVPARVEARGLVLCALIFGGLVYLLGAGVLMSGLKEDEARAANVKTLLGSAAGACFVISIMSAMAYLAKFMTFMKLHLEASQPITNAGFFFLYFGAMFGIMVANSYVSYYLFWFACFAMIVALFFAGTMAIRAAVAQALLFARMRRVIMKYIRDE
jgi:hypothetical protein